jgi:hypothetical protein
VERSGGHLRPMWAWGCVERVATGLLGAHGEGRWNTAVAVGVTAAAGLALVAILVSSRRLVGPRYRTAPSLKSFLWLSAAAAYCPVSALAPMQGRAQIAVVEAAEEGAADCAGVARPVHAEGEASGRRGEASEESSGRSKSRTTQELIMY